MHLGNLYAALMSWLSVRRRGGRWILRIEDLDPQRSRLEFARQIEDDLRWLGLDWDEGGVDSRGPNGPYVQSLRSDLYREALSRLDDTGLTYPCYCTRAELHAPSAPHASDGRFIYPGTCRPPRLSGRRLPDRKPSTRIIVPDRDITFTDLICGPQSVNLAREIGDFILRRADGAWAYQLAVVTDDALMGVTEVMRGDDLLTSAAQQIYLYELLGYRPPEFAHIPLMLNEQGIRLSKRDTSLSMEALRASHTPQSLLGLLAHRAGLIPTPTPTPITLDNLLKAMHTGCSSDNPKPL